MLKITKNRLMELVAQKKYSKRVEELTFHEAVLAGNTARKVVRTFEARAELEVNLAIDSI